MNNATYKTLESLLARSARDFPYPPTPDLVPRLRAPHPSIRLKGWRFSTLLAGAVLVTVLGLMAVPDVRAQILEFIQLGAIRIWLGEPTAQPTVLALTPPPGTTQVESGAGFLGLDGATSLLDARNRSGIPLLLPEYPPDLGSPDRVFLQDLGGPAVLYLWLSDSSQDAVELSLLALGPGAFAGKGAPHNVQTTTVNGQPALWLQGTHTLLLFGGQDREVQLVVNGNVLLWELDGITYRLESALPLEQAVAIAESLRPVE